MRPLFSISALIFLGTAPVGVSAAAPVPQRLVLQNSGAAAQVANIPTPPSRSAIVTACADLVQQGSDDIFKRESFSKTLVSLCGGPDAVTPTLKSLLQDKDPETRRVAARVAGLSRYNIFYANEANTVKSQALMISALSDATQDRNADVRLAALKSLEDLTELLCNVSSVPYWQRALPSLTRAANSSNPQIRLAALRVLVYLPIDVSSATASLRLGLQGTKDERNYALAALCHAAQQNRLFTASVFLQDLASADLSKRRQAAADLHLAIVPLFSGGFPPTPYPLPDWDHDSRLCLSGVFAFDQLPEAQQKQKSDDRRANLKEAQDRLLKALVQAVADSDASVRQDAAASFQELGDWTTFWRGSTNTFNTGMEALPRVKAAFAQAVATAQSRDPQIAAQLRTMQESVIKGPVITGGL